MTDLADLFSTSSPSRSPPPPPRRASPLFLSPSASSTAPTPIRTRTSKRRISPSPPPPLDLDLTAFDLSDLPPPLPLPSTSRNAYADPMAGYVDPFAGVDGGDDLGGEGRGGKKRKPIPKVDVDRLMGENGIPALMRAAKLFKPHGKGHEASDLRDLLGVYQMWAHGMFPKGDFAGTIQRVENVCRTRRMENAMKGYREAFYPPARSPTPPILSPGHTPPRVTSPRAVRETSILLPVVGAGTGNEDAMAGGEDGDMEEMMAVEEMEREEARQRPAAEAGPPVVEEEDEWEGLYD